MQPEFYINRELSWLEFNQRVLDRALDDELPLLERLKFLAISSSNLDEFFMVRVGGLQLQRKAAVNSTDPAGMSVVEQLDSIRERTNAMLSEQYRIYNEKLLPVLAQHGIQRVAVDSCSVKHLQTITHVFEEEIFPVLSPMAVEEPGRFPLLSGRHLHLAVQIKAEDTESGFRFVLIPIGKSLSRIVVLPTDQGFSFTLLEDVVRHFVGRFFPNEEVLSTAVFRITRNADISVQEDSAADLLLEMKELLQQRKSAECVRLEVDPSVSQDLLQFLQKSLCVTEQETIEHLEPLDLSVLMKLSGLDGFEYLRDTPWPPQRNPEVDVSASMFDIIAAKDLILCHPYESYQPVVHFLDEAADDPDVLAIKQTLYRTGRNSGIVRALMRAAEKGKYVTAIVELKARFDEAQNIEWAEELEEAGVQVMYGVKGLKTHAKVCIVVRREPQGTVRYMHFGTGNYNESTAKLYSDISYFSCHPNLGKDASTFFNAITGYSQPQQYSMIAAAPLGLRKKLLQLIEGEIERKRQGLRASIMAKFNSLVDSELIQALYDASRAGVTVQLNVRGICCLRPGVPGVSENITVVSVVDRMLEHARMLYFHHGGDELLFLSSADWMPRNLDKRVELLVPILEKSCKKRFVQVLQAYFRDTESSWQLNAKGQYIRNESEGLPFRAQEVLYQSAVQALKLEDKRRSTMFEPHQPAKHAD